MKDTVRITLLADLHHYSETLGTKGRAFELRSGSDQKCLAETGGIIDAAFSKIENSDTQAVLILGDVSNNGERVSHEELREKLYKLQKKKDVYLITATHDWCCDKNPRRFEGDKTFHDVPVMKSDELRDFYFDFGPKQAKSEFITHLGTCSYTVDVGESVRILCLNDDQNGKGKAGFKEDHFKWIEEQIALAREENKFLIGIEHHLLMPHIHSMLGNGSTCVGDREKVASRLADAGLHYMFVGHSHIQAIDSFTSKKGNRIIEVNVGSLCGYPSPIVNAEISDSGVRITTTAPGNFVYEGKTYDALSYTKKHTLGLVDNIFDAAEKSKEDFSQRLSALGIDGEKAAKLYFIAHPLIKYIRNVTVGQGYNKLKLFGLGKMLDKNIIAEFKNKPVIDFAHEIILSAFDGGKKTYKPTDSYYKAVTDFMNIPVKIKDCSLTRNLKQCVENVLKGPEYNINDCTLPNLYK